MCGCSMDRTPLAPHSTGPPAPRGQGGMGTEHKADPRSPPEGHHPAAWHCAEHQGGSTMLSPSRGTAGLQPWAGLGNGAGLEPWQGSGGTMLWAPPSPTGTPSTSWLSPMHHGHPTARPPQTQRAPHVHHRHPHVLWASHRPRAPHPTPPAVGVPCSVGTIGPPTRHCAGLPHRAASPLTCRCVAMETGEMLMSPWQREPPNLRRVGDTGTGGGGTGGCWSCSSWPRPAAVSAAERVIGTAARSQRR